MKNRIDNILKHKTLSRLPRGCFFSGDCPGAAAITIFCSLFSSLWGTLGRRTEVGSRKTEVGRQLVPHFLFPNFLNADRSKDAVRFAYDATPLDLSACTAPDNVGQIKKGKENNEHRIMNNEYRIRKSEVRSQKSEVGSPKREPGFDNLLNHCSNFLAPLSPLAKGDEIRPLVAGSEGVVTPTNVGKENNEHRISNNESGSFSGIPVPYFLFPEKGKRPETTPGRVEIAPGIRKMTQGRVEIAPEFKKMTQGRVKIASGLRKMTHGRVKIASGLRKMTHGRVKTAPGRVEYAPGPLPARHSLIFRCAPTAPGYRVGTPEKPEMGLIKGENKEHRISNNEYRIRKAENACLPDRQGIRNLTGNGISTKFQKSAPSPLLWGGREGLIPHLPRGCFFSGDCPGAAAITIFYSLFSSLWGTAGFGGARCLTVSDSLFLIIYFLFSSFGNKKHRISLPGLLTGNVKSGRYPLNADRSKGAVPDFTGTGRFRNVASSADLPAPVEFISSGSASIRPDNVGQTEKENNEYRIRKAENACLPDRQGIRNLTGNDTSTSFLSPSPFGEGRGEANNESGKNIPVRCTSRYHTLSGATNINGALHLGFQNADTAISGIAAAQRNTLSRNRRVCRTAISEIAAAPRNICRTNGHPSEKKVQRTEKLKENNKYRITNKEYRIRKAEDACLPDRQGIRNLTANDIPTKFQKSAPSPPLWGGREGLSPHLPRGGFYSGDCPGAAAITIFISIFSSSRLSPNFAGAMRLAVPNRLAPLTILSVANQQALHRSSFVPLVKGDKSRFIGTGGHEYKIPENQEVSTTSPKIRMKGFLKERRYAVT